MYQSSIPAPPWTGLWFFPKLVEEKRGLYQGENMETPMVLQRGRSPRFSNCSCAKHSRSLSIFLALLHITCFYPKQCFNLMITDENINLELRFRQDPAASGMRSKPVYSCNTASKKCVCMVRNIVQSCSLILDKASILWEKYEEQLYVSLK